MSERLLHEIDQLSETIEEGLAALAALCVLTGEPMPLRALEEVSDLLSLDWTLGLDSQPEQEGEDELLRTIERSRLLVSVQRFRLARFRCGLCDEPMLPLWKQKDTEQTLLHSSMSGLSPVCDACTIDLTD